jgi:hypothetical protein
MIPMLLPREASAYLLERGVSHTVQTLAKLRYVGGGPRYRKIGARVAYPVAELDAYVKTLVSGLYSSTKDYGS